MSGSSQLEAINSAIYFIDQWYDILGLEKLIKLKVSKSEMEESENRPFTLIDTQMLGEKWKTTGTSIYVFHERD